MKITDSQAKKLLGDSVPRQFSQLGFGLLVTRMKGVYKNDPSLATLQRCTQEINAFLQKFETIMQKDSEILSKL